MIQASQTITEKKSCTGCGACVATCPKECIVLCEDSVGFLYPQICLSECIHCNLCQKVCPENNPIIASNALNPICYAGWALSEKIRSESASGGVFTLLAESILKKDAIIYGAAFDNHFKLSYIRITHLEELEKIKSSKYCQAHPKTLLRDIASDLCNGKLVLFGGTACQIAGILAYLEHKKISTKRFLTCGLICHGAAPNKLLKDSVSFFEKKYGDAIIAINQRCKIFCDTLQSPLTTCITFQSKCKKNIEFNNNPYMFGFLSGLFFRENCYACRYAQIPRIEDITLGDYFEIDKDLIDNEKKGVSVIVLNTSKAASFFEQCHFEFQLFPIPLDQVIARKHSFTHPSIKNKFREKFLIAYKDFGFNYVEKKYLRYHSIRSILKRNINYLRGKLSRLKKSILK